MSVWFSEKKATHSDYRGYALWLPSFIAFEDRIKDRAASVWFPVNLGVSEDRLFLLFIDLSICASSRVDTHSEHRGYALWTPTTVILWICGLASFSCVMPSQEAKYSY